jgi:hypothetical protein
MEHVATLEKKGFAYQQIVTSDPYTILSISSIVSKIGCPLQGFWQWEMKDF